MAPKYREITDVVRELSMKVFICWSGEQSRKLAKALRNWIPSVIQAVQPFYSGQDIRSGQHWPKQIGEHLKDTKFGILCLTPGNTSEAWINFEAGALAKNMESARVVPLLFGGVSGTISLEGPLKLFQGVTFDRDGVRKLLDSINDCLGDQQLSKEILDSQFSKWWDDLSGEVGRILQEAAESKPESKSLELATLEEILIGVRELQRSLPSAPQLLEAILKDIKHRTLIDALDLLRDPSQQPLGHLHEYGYGGGHVGPFPPPAGQIGT